MQHAPIPASHNDPDRTINVVFIAIRDSLLFHIRLSKLLMDINSFLFRLLAFPFAIAHQRRCLFCFFLELQ
ncbi:MAG TPA: hypothetical protein DGQ94_21175 [Pseudomonas sp.]|nr:hypothetical protein DZC31_01615 [Stenotrophomonas rhizophila]PIK78652.1 hypothetical protein CQW31_10455 [Pseudomonas sp. 382]HCV41176.1 hypothetical protein [Pseudomonas sp.]